MVTLRVLSLTAEYGNYQSMFTVAQLGMQVPDMCEMGRAYMEHLIDIGLRYLPRSLMISF